MSQQSITPTQWTKKNLAARQGFVWESAPTARLLRR